MDQVKNTLKGIGFKVGFQKHSCFKAACASQGESIQDVFLLFMDRYIENPGILNLITRKSK